jgi:hypothetical protein
MPSPQPGPSSLPQTGGGRPSNNDATRMPAALNIGSSSTSSSAGPGYRQGGTIPMQQNYPGTSTLQGGQRQKVTMEDLTQYYLNKMGSPEEYERKHPRGKFSKLLHEKESPVSVVLVSHTSSLSLTSTIVYWYACVIYEQAQRQRRHAEHKARDLADALAYRAPVYRPGPYGCEYGCLSLTK